MYTKGRKLSAAALDFPDIEFEKIWSNKLNTRQENMMLDFEIKIRKVVELQKHFILHPYVIDSHLWVRAAETFNGRICEKMMLYKQKLQQRFKWRKGKRVI